MSPDGRFGLDQRGASIVLVAIAMVALLGITALAVDVGMLLTGRTEAQRTADAAAHAGAVEWFMTDGDADAIRSRAQQVASINPIIQAPPSVLDGDVEILSDRVRVTVYRTADRDNPVQTFFARILGFDEVDVAAVAAARIAYAHGAGCALPLVLIDKWIDADMDQQWDPDIDTYIPYPQEGYTGYSTDDAGLQVEIKDVNQDGGGPPQCADTGTYEACKAFGDPSWDCWWREALPSQGGGGGTDELSPRIRSCVIEGMEIGDPIWSASGAGNKQSLVDDFKWLVDNDPDIEWDDDQKCPARNGVCDYNSIRIRSVPLVSPPSIVPDGGANTRAEIANWTGVFIEKVACSPNEQHGAEPRGRWNVYVRLTKILGTGADGPDGSLLQSIQLVE